MGVFKVLSIDGGGIRGVIPAMVLEEIEHRTGKPSASVFDLIAGTSTGGILALGLTKPSEHDQTKPQFGADQLVKLYEENGETIFPHHMWAMVRSLVEDRYPADGIEQVLGKYFGMTRLSEALTPVLVTSYEIEQRIPFFFRSTKAKADPSYDFPMAHVARATSAAPTYFEPAKIPNDRAGYFALIDGGVFANNPGMCAFVDAIATIPNGAQVLVVSLGTGSLTRRYPYDKAKGWGLVSWARPLMDIVFDGGSETVDYQLKELLPAGADRKRRYYRFQCTLDHAMDDMDDATPANIHMLKVTAESLIHEQEADLTELCRQLMQ